MIVNLKYFYEKTHTDYDEYNNLWHENIERIIFLHTHLSLRKQISSIINDITDNKDILAIRFPSNKIIKQNKIINDIISGKGFIYTDNKIWYPKEVWIYNPIN
tara:strand:+ start:61 stop:369 length:309 start_codon:yes stop_codon:yes gene_type:complete